MKYASIDIETTGLNPDNAKIIEIGVILDDLANPQPIESLPTFHCYVDCETFIGQAYALSMHGKIFERIAKKTPGFLYCKEGNVESYLFDFFAKNGYDRRTRINAAGKNFASFDSKFLSRLPKMNEFENPSILFSHRVIDPAMLYWNPMTDKALPDTKTCYERAGIKEEVAHTALDDARGIIKLLRAKFCFVE